MNCNDTNNSCWWYSRRASPHRRWLTCTRWLQKCGRRGSQRATQSTGAGQGNGCSARHHHSCTAISTFSAWRSNRTCLENLDPRGVFTAAKLMRCKKSSATEKLFLKGNVFFSSLKQMWITVWTFLPSRKMQQHKMAPLSTARHSSV